MIKLKNYPIEDICLLLGFQGSEVCVFGGDKVSHKVMKSVSERVIEIKNPRKLNCGDFMSYWNVLNEFL